MSLLILQIVIKQWDKSQRTEAHERLRATIPDRYRIIFPPAFYVFDLSLTGIIGCMKKSL